MDETPTSSTICPICAALVAAADEHARWHRELPRELARQQKMIGSI